MRAGDHWWLREPDGTGHTNAGDPRAGVDMGSSLEMLHTRSLLGCAHLAMTGDEQVAGRRAAILHASPRADSEHFRWWGYAQPFDVAVDLERGVALRGPYIAVTEISFDEAFDDRLFSPPFREDDAPVRSSLEHPKSCSLEEARRTVSFAVKMPRALPAGARLVRCLLDPGEPARWVGVSWTTAPGDHFYIHLRQGPAVEAETTRPVWRVIQRDGDEFKIEQPNGNVTVLAEREGSWFELSSNLPVASVIEILRSTDRQ